MKVLITGGYGFIGSHVAERFYKEGHQVYIIDNLSSGNKQNIDFRHYSYIMGVEDEKCREVFKSNKFDVVIHLAAQINVTESLENPYLDTKTNLLGLTNMLDLSKKYNVKKFIFASSAAVYGNNESLPLTEQTPTSPLSPYGMSKLAGELYCNKWREVYGLNTLCFRFSNVYGSRQGVIGEGGVISIFLKRLYNHKKFTIYGDGNQTRDFIYVEDVADAIYRSVYVNIGGVLNLSTNTQNSVNDIVKVFEKIHPVEGVLYEEPRVGDILNSFMDNTKVKKELDWVPMYSIEEGLRKTCEWLDCQYFFVQFLFGHFC